MGSCNALVLMIYMFLLSIKYLHNKDAVVTKVFVKSISLGVQFLQRNYKLWL